MLTSKAFRTPIDKTSIKIHNLSRIPLPTSIIYDQQGAYSCRNNMTLLSFVVMIGVASSRNCS